METFNLLKILQVLKKINTEEFMRQKNWLYQQITISPQASRMPEGILNLLDHIQDICEETLQMEFPAIKESIKDETVYTKIQQTDSIGYADVIKIIFDQRCITHYVDDERLLKVTFADVLEIAKTNGYKNGVITLIAENPLNGRVYLYGNYGPFWVECGSTNGYA